MDEKLFDVITAPHSKRCGVQCKKCGATSGTLRVGEELDGWCDAHECGKEDKPVEEAEKTGEATPPSGTLVNPNATSDSDGDEEEDEE